MEDTIILQEVMITILVRMLLKYMESNCTEVEEYSLTNNNYLNYSMKIIDSEYLQIIKEFEDNDEDGDDDLEEAVAELGGDGDGDNGNDSDVDVDLAKSLANTRL